MAQRFAIVTPVYDDWDSLCELLRRLDSVLANIADARFDVIIVDDGSTLAMPESLLRDSALVHLGRLDVVHLACNLGHQRAIAIGLSEVDGRGDYQAAIVMDSDGEDRPEDVPALVAQFRERPGDVVVARRASRSESGTFRFFYVIYRMLFHLLTGTPIAFGNFCLLPAPVVGRLVFMPEIWNNLPAALRRSRLPIRELPIDRGTRYHGRSRMSFVRLVVHGLSAVSVYSDVAFTRVLVFSVVLAGATMLGIAIVIMIRLFTELAIPGWASSTFGSLVIVLMQALLLSTGAVFLLLNNRSMPSIIPRHIAAQYVRSTTALRAA